MAGLINPKGRLRWADVQFVSLVRRGANQQPVLYKDDDGGDLGSAALLTKLDAERGELLTIAMVAERRDAHGMVADAEVIKEAAHSFAKNGFKVDLRHDGRKLEPTQAHVAESFIIQKGDPRFGDWKDLEDQPVDLTGSWAIIYKIDDPALRDQIKRGEIGGASIYGRGLVDLNKADELAARLSKRLRGEIHVDKDELVALLKANNDALVAGITAAIKPAPKNDGPPAADGPPKFTGNRLSATDLAKHAKALEQYELVKGVDMNDPAAVAELAKKLAGEGQETPEQKLARVEKELQAKTAELGELRKGSHQPAGGTPKDGGGEPDKFKRARDFVDTLAKAHPNVLA